MIPLDFRVPVDKLTLYLLNTSHPRGQSKAKFFLAHSLNAAKPAELAHALMAHAVSWWPGRPHPTQYGMRHEITGPMRLPDGSEKNVLAIWQIDPSSGIANFVTAYPQ